MNKEKISEIKKLLLSKKAKKIITTAAITLAVFLFFIWLGVGMYISVPAEKRAELWPVFGMYIVFPALIFFFGAKRVYDTISGDDDSDDEENT